MTKRKSIHILHAPTDVGNQAWSVSQGERKLGLDSRVLVYMKLFSGFGADYNLHFRRYPRLVRLFIAIVYFIWALFRFNYFHFYFTTTFFPGYIDLPILKLFRKKLFFTFQGCDIRPATQCAPAVIDPVKHCHAPLEVQRRRLNKILKYAEQTYVLNPDLLIPSPQSKFLPYATIEIQTLTPEYKEFAGDREVVVFHAPSDRLVKGSDYVEAAIARLQKQGYKVRLDLKTKVPHDQVIASVRQADLVVDQLLVGWYGGFAVESMALGKPTICYINSEWLSWTPMKNDCPIINATSQTIYDILKNQLDHPEGWLEIGRNSRFYAEKYHSPEVIAQQLIMDYERSL